MRDMGSNPITVFMQQITTTYLDLDKIRVNGLGEIPDECNIGIYLFNQEELKRCLALNIGILRLWSGKPVLLLSKKELREFKNAGKQSW